MLDEAGRCDRLLLIRDGRSVRSVQSRVQIYVDLADEMAKGIHMSRLYLILDEHSETRPLSTAGLKRFVVRSAREAGLHGLKLQGGRFVLR